MVHTALIACSSEVSWKMILDVDSLRHVLHIVTQSLIAILILVVLVASSVILNIGGQLLTFGCRTLELVEVILILTPYSTD